jgi:hypothetical protein
MIFIETARRLHYTYKFSYLDIDTLHMYHLPLRCNNSQGLIWDISQRYLLIDWIFLICIYKHHFCFSDQLLWPGAQMSMLSHLPSSHIDPNMNIYDIVMKDVIAFCDNLNCLCSYCKIHGEENFLTLLLYNPNISHQDMSHPISPPKPMMTDDAIRLLGGPPCGGDCYKLYLEGDAKSELVCDLLWYFHCVLANLYITSSIQSPLSRNHGVK